MLRKSSTNRLFTFCVLLLATLLGCAGNLEQTRKRVLSANQYERAKKPGRQRCQQLSDRRQDWSAVGTAFGIIAAPLGVASLPGDGKVWDDNQLTGRGYMIVGASVMTGIGTAAHFIATGAGDRWLEEGCAQ